MAETFAEILSQDPFSSWLPYIIAFVVGFLVVVRTYMGGQMCPSTARLDGKTVIVTGGCSGIGLETVKELSRRGARVIMACRDIVQGQAEIHKIYSTQKKARIVVREIDLADMSSVVGFAKKMLEDYEEIDILINNAGINFHPPGQTVDEFEIHMATNYLGHFLLTHELLPLLKAAPQGRIINVSAHAYISAQMDINDPLDLAGENQQKQHFYNSKLALILMAKYMTVLLDGTNVTINALSPGLVRGTRHMRHSPVFSSFTLKLSIFPWMWLLMKTPIQGAQTSIYLATDPKLHSVSGKFFNDCEETETSTDANDDKLATSLYLRSCAAICSRGINMTFLKPNLQNN